MSVEQAMIAAGVPVGIARAEAPGAQKAMIEAGVTTERRATMFLAQVLHESVLLRYWEEIASGREYEGRKDLGNVHPGDGVRYKGRGPIQLTGRANYRAAGIALGLPLETHPDLVERHDIGWRVAGWYWKTRGLNAIADSGNFRTVTVRINGAATEGAPSYYSRRRQLLAEVSKFDCIPHPESHLIPIELKVVREIDRLREIKKPGPSQRKQLREAIEEATVYRKAVWRAANTPGGGGWNVRHRAERYRSLKARTT